MTTRIFSLSTARRDIPSGESFTLALEELMPNASGEIVVPNQTGTDVTVLTDDNVTSLGIETRQVTNSGETVAGLAYCRFDSGITVFYPRSHHLCLGEAE
jgi:hypothetical protein